MLRRSKRVFRSAVDAAANKAIDAVSWACSWVGLDYVIEMLGLDDDDDVPASEFVPPSNVAELIEHELDEDGLKALREGRGTGRKMEA